MSANSLRKHENDHNLNKSHLRDRFKNLLSAMSSIEHAERSAQVSNTILKWIEANTAIRRIASFYPLNNEIDISPLNEKLWSKSFFTAFPKVLGEREMSFFYANKQRDFAKGAFGVWEPTGDQICPKQEIDLILVPGLGFDKAGARLGKGQAFYDHYLSDCNAIRMGVCFLEQWSDENLPTENHDVSMHLIATENGVFDGERK